MEHEMCFPEQALFTVLFLHSSSYLLDKYSNVYYVPGPRGAQGPLIRSYLFWVLGAIDQILCWMELEPVAGKASALTLVSLVPALYFGLATWSHAFRGWPDASSWGVQGLPTWTTLVLNHLDSNLKKGVVEKMSEVEVLLELGRVPGDMALWGRTCLACVRIWGFRYWCLYFSLLHVQGAMDMGCV